jgi:hypothetical protein
VVHPSLVLSRAFVKQVGVTSAALDPSDVLGFVPGRAISADTTTVRMFNVICGDATDFDETAIGDSSLFTVGD